MTHRTLLILLGSLSVALASGPLEDSGGGLGGMEVANAPVLLAEAPPHVERFQLFPRGKRWKAERVSLGSGKIVSRREGSGVLLEMELELTDIATRIQRTYRSDDGSDGTFVYREWRQSGGGSQAGHSLILEGLPTGPVGAKALLREWAGGAVRHGQPNVPAGSLSMLQFVEQERVRGALDEGKGGAPASWQPLFDDLEGTWGPALILRTPLGIGGLLRGARLVDVFPSSGARHSRWLFQGEQLLGFLEGNLEGCRDLGPLGVTLVSAERSSL